MFKDQSIFPELIIFKILITFSIDHVLIVLGENWLLSHQSGCGSGFVWPFMVPYNCSQCVWGFSKIQSWNRYLYFSFYLENRSNKAIFDSQENERNALPNLRCWLTTSSRIIINAYTALCNNTSWKLTLHFYHDRLERLSLEVYLPWFLLQ